MRVVRVRTGVVLDRGGGALAKMLPFFRLGIGGPVAGGRQYMPWIHVDDLVGVYLAALDGDGWSGAGQRHRAGAGDEQGVLAGRSAARCAGRPSRRCPPSRSARCTARWRTIVVTGQRAVPERTQALGYRFAHPELDEALRSALHT